MKIHLYVLSQAGSLFSQSPQIMFLATGSPVLNPELKNRKRPVNIRKIADL